MLRSVLCGLLMAAAVSCQSDLGALMGVVTEKSGAVVAGARITVVNTATAASYQTGTKGTGQYRMSGLPPGSYSLTFEAPRFRRLVRNRVRLRASETIRADATLERER